MLFQHRLVLSNCDALHFGVDPTVCTAVEPIFRRHLHTGMLCGHGIVLNAGILADVLGADLAFENTRFIDGCHQLFDESCTSGDKPFIIIRGLNMAEVDLVKFYDSRPDDWRLTSYGLKRRSELSNKEKDEVYGRLERLTRHLCNHGAKAEPISPDAANRLRNYMLGRMAILRSKNVNRRFVRVDDVELEIEFDELDRIVATSKNRSDTYTQLDTLVSAKSDDLRARGYNKEEIVAKASKLSDTVRKELIDPAYDAIFVNPQEIHARGEFNCLSENLSKLVGGLTKVSNWRDHLLNSAEDWGINRTFLEKLPVFAKRFYLIVEVAFNSHASLSIFSEPIQEFILSNGIRIAGTYSWNLFRQYFAHAGGIEPFSVNWDKPEELMRLTSNDVSDVPSESWIKIINPAEEI